MEKWKSRNEKGAVCAPPPLWCKPDAQPFGEHSPRCAEDVRILQSDALAFLMFSRCNETEHTTQRIKTWRTDTHKAQRHFCNVTKSCEMSQTFRDNAPLPSAKIGQIFEIRKRFFEKILKSPEKWGFRAYASRRNRTKPYFMRVWERKTYFPRVWSGFLWLCDKLHVCERITLSERFSRKITIWCKQYLAQPHKFMEQWIQSKQRTASALGATEERKGYKQSLHASQIRRADTTRASTHRTQEERDSAQQHRPALLAWCLSSSLITQRRF